MRKVLTYLVLVLFLLNLALAQEELSCVSDEDCFFLVGETSTCDQETFLCTIEQTTTEPTHPILSQPITLSTTNQDTQQLQTQIDNLINQVNQLQSSDTEITSQLQEIKSQLSSLSQKIESIKQQDLPKFNTGLASLQKEVQNTSEEITLLQNTVAEKSSSNWLIYLILVLVILAAFGLLIYFVGVSKLKSFISSTPAKEVPNEIHQYITQGIKKGKKYPQIKTELLKNGWSEEEIRWAYKESTRKNYLQFMQKGTSSSPNSNSETISSSPQNINSDKAKMLTIAGIVIFLIIIAIFALGKSSGLAIYTQKLIGGNVNGTNGEISYGLECTPPHILNPEETSCCLDLNNNTKCDFIENAESMESVAEGKKCVDNRQCGENLCLNRECHPLSSIFTKPLSSCSKVCNVYSLEISTSDRETYTLRPKQGSYTGAGSLEWTVLSLPNYCIEDKALIPIQLTKKNPGKILNTEVITLKEGQTSSVIKHPYVKSLAFSFKIDKVYQVCELTEAELQITLNKYNLQRSVMQVKRR